MRFLVEYKDFKSKATKNASLELVETFLNEHLIGSYHGGRFECLIIRFAANSPTARKFQLKTLYQTFAILEVGIMTENDRKVTLADFMAGLLAVEGAIKKGSLIEVKDEKLSYLEEELVNDYRKALDSAPTTMEELKRYAKNQKETKFQNRVKRVDGYIRIRSENPLPLTKRLIDIVVSEDSGEKVLSSSAYRFAEVLSNLLRRAEVKAPGYERIVINIAQSLEEAKQEVPVEEWYSLTYAALDVRHFVAATEDERFHMMLKSIKEGLHLIADFDHLEKDKIEQVLDVVVQKGLDMEMVFGAKQNEQYRAELLYQVPNGPDEKADFRLRVTDLASGMIGASLLRQSCHQEKGNRHNGAEKLSGRTYAENGESS